jgi:Xaa-Pro aminopeptidase
MTAPDFAAHRQRLLAALPQNEGVLLFGAPERTRNADSEHKFRQDSDVWWLTGWPDAEVAVFLRHGEKPFTLFVQPRDKEKEVWNGRRPGPEGAVEAFGAAEAFPIGDLDKELPRLLQGLDALHYGFGSQPGRDRQLLNALAKARKEVRRHGKSVPTTFHLPMHLVHELRLRKTPDEVEVLRRAAHVTAKAHVAAMQAGAPGTPEYDLDALLLHHFRRGGYGPGYTNIVAAGDNATILHYITNDDTIADGELVLIDAGAEVLNYTADVTRTWPANGVFSPAQRAVYAIVLEAQLLSIDRVRAGVSFKDLHDTSVRRLTEGMVELGLLAGDVDELIRTEKFKKYYMHGTSHWLGVDVHDAGAYGRHGVVRVLEPGMVLTIEPGLYIPVDDQDAPEALRGIGVRIEDDVLVTDGEPDVLTAACPKAIDDLEAICRRG